MNPQPFQDLSGISPHRSALHKTSRGRFAAQEQIGGHIQAIHQSQVLINCSDSKIVGIARISHGHRLSRQPDNPPIRRQSPRNNLNQGRFTGPIVTNQRQNFPRIEFKTDFFHCADMPEMFADVLHFEDGCMTVFARSLSVCWCGAVNDIQV